MTDEKMFGDRVDAAWAADDRETVKRMVRSRFDEWERFVRDNELDPAVTVEEWKMAAGGSGDR